jgi:hypothetical protein
MVHFDPQVEVRAADREFHGTRPGRREGAVARHIGRERGCRQIRFPVGRAHGSGAGGRDYCAVGLAAASEGGRIGEGRWLRSRPPSLDLGVAERVDHRDRAHVIVEVFLLPGRYRGGDSRIWGGIHWPVDNERGQELGQKVGENAWQRAHQFVLGTASPAAAVFLALRPPYWFYDDVTPDHPAQFRTSGGLAIDVSAGGAGAWRSIIVDPMPAGSYELKLAVAATGDQPVRLAAVVEASQGGADGVIGKTEAILQPAGTPSIVTIPWTSDGVRAFRVSIEARVDSGSAAMLVSAISARRIWPMLAGSPRYYEMSSASLPD